MNTPPPPDHVILQDPSAPLPWRHYLPIALLALIGLLATGIAFRQVTNWERQRTDSTFEEAARDRVLVIQRELEHSLGLIQDLGNLFDASRQIRRYEFHKFVAPVLKRYSSIQALQWIPGVSGTERQDFELAARTSIPWFIITERDAKGRLLPAGRRGEYFPILYIQPFQPNQALLGLDLGMEPAARPILTRAAETGRMMMTESQALLNNADQAYRFVAYQPVYQGGEAADREDAGTAEIREAPRPPLRGYSAGIFRLGDIVEHALTNLTPSGIDISFYDASPDEAGRLLYLHSSRKRGAETDAQAPPSGAVTGPRLYAQTLNIANREWKVICAPIGGEFEPDLWGGWVVLVSGLAFNLLLTAYLSSLVGRATEVRRLVAKRTTQLLEANQALASEITERERAERKLQRLNLTLERRVAKRSAEAERRAEDLEQFAYVTSHDLKAPLRAIANLAGWLQEDLADKLDDATREQLTLLHDRVGRMHALIEGLLSYSRVGRTESVREVVDVADLLEEIVDSLSPPDGFVVEIGDGMPTLNTDRLHLGQVFANLLSNSLKHRDTPEGHVWITVRELDKMYEFTVADDGPGIAPEYQDKVFMMFQTLSPRDYGSDTGIGLALVKKIVQEHGGSITLRSEPGQGASFRFTWQKSG